MDLLRSTATLIVGASMTIAPSAVLAQNWTEAFGMSPAQFILDGEIAKAIPKSALTPIKGTVRFTLAVSVPGKALRIRLSNELSNEPLTIAAASIAVVSEDGKPSGLTPLTFAGRPAITVAPGAPLVSDLIPMNVTPRSRVTVSLYLPNGVSFAPLGDAGMSVAPGNQTLATVVTSARAFRGRPLVSGVEVETPDVIPVVVTLGDSITDGMVAKPEGLHGWPDMLAIRLQGLPVKQRKAVVNAGIGGNRVISDGWGPAAVARLDRDVLRIGNVSHLIVLEGINDIGMSGNGPFGSNAPIAASEIIAGYQQIIARAHARGIKVVGATLLPFKGAAYFTEPKEEVRQEVNQWIRTSRAYDAVIDTDLVMRDPKKPLSLLPEYDSGDHLHPNETGYRAIGTAIPLSVFR